MGDSGNIGERVASLEAVTGTAVEELRRLREQNHQRIKDDNARDDRFNRFSAEALAELKFMRQGMADINANITRYQDECDDAREELEDRLDEAEDRIAESHSLKRYLVSTGAGIVGLVGLVVNIAAWARK